MAIKDFGKGFKSSLHDAIDTVKAKAKEVELPDIMEAGEKTSERIKSLFKKTDGISFLMKRQYQHKTLPASQHVLQSRLYIFLWRQMEKSITEKKKSLI